MCLVGWVGVFAFRRGSAGSREVVRRGGGVHVLLQPLTWLVPWILLPWLL